MKRLLITVSAIALLTAPAMAQSSKSSSDAASRAAAVASGGYHSMTNNFGGSKIPPNTPDVMVSPGSASGAHCQLPGWAFGMGLQGTGFGWGIPGGNDEECKALELASFYAKLANSVTDPQEAREYRQTAKEITCQIPRMQGTRQCPSVVPATYTSAATTVTATYSGIGAHPPGGWQAVPMPTPAYSYADLKATPWYCDNPAGYYPAVSLCSAWRQVPR